MSADKARLREILRKYSVFGFLLSRRTWDWLELSKLGEIPFEKSPKGEVYFLRQLSDRINQKLAQSTQNPIPIHGGELS